MTTIHAPDRCDPRARRIAQVKFVALDWDGPETRTIPAPGLFTTVRAFLIRVIGRLEAARP